MLQCLQCRIQVTVGSFKLLFSGKEHLCEVDHIVFVKYDEVWNERLIYCIIQIQTEMIIRYGKKSEKF